MPRVCNECGADMPSVIIYKQEDTGDELEQFYCPECDNSILVPIAPVESSQTHLLKTWPEFFVAIMDGIKTFEYRKNDRDFKPGDTLVLAEYEPENKAFTGQRIQAKVTYVLKGKMGVPDGYAVLSFKIERTV